MTLRPRAIPSDANGSPKALPRLAVSPGELAQMTGVAESTVRCWMRDQGLPFCRVGGRILIPVRLFDDWLLEHRDDRGRELDAQVGQIVGDVLQGSKR